MTHPLLGKRVEVGAEEERDAAWVLRPRGINFPDESVRGLRFSKKTLLVVCGLHKSGKSTLARRVAKDVPVVDVSVVYKELPEERGSVHLRAHNQVLKRLRAFLKEGPVILDALAMHADRREDYQQTARSHGAKTHCLLINTSPEECRKRAGKDLNDELFATYQRLMEEMMEEISEGSTLGYDSLTVVSDSAIQAVSFGRALK